EDVRERALQNLAGRREDEPRALLLRSIARDPEVIEPLVRALRSDDPALRAVAARGIELSGDPGTSDALARALGEERDPEAFRRMAVAAVTLGAAVPYRAVRGHLIGVEVGPEAMALAAGSAQGWGRREREEVARRLRSALRAE